MKNVAHGWILERERDSHEKLLCSSGKFIQLLRDMENFTSAVKILRGNSPGPSNGSASRALGCLDSKHTKNALLSASSSNSGGNRMAAFLFEKCSTSSEMIFSRLIQNGRTFRLQRPGARGVCNEITLYMGLRHTTMTPGSVQYRKSAGGSSAACVPMGLPGDAAVKKQSSFSRLRALRESAMYVFLQKQALRRGWISD